MRGFPRFLDHAKAPHAKAGAPRRTAMIVAAGAWVYLAAALIGWLVMAITADRWWLATLAMFGPRWVGLLPLALLCPAALILRRRSLPVLLGAAAIVLFAIMGFCVPWRLAVQRSGGGQQLRLVTCNIHRHALDATAFSAWLDQTRPDVVILQEWSSRFDPLFPKDHWHVERNGELFIASRYPIVNVSDLGAGRWDSAGTAVCYEVASPGGSVQVLNVHLDSPHKALEAVIDDPGLGPTKITANSQARWHESMTIAALAKTVHGPLLIGGDFNTPAQSVLFGRCWSDWSDAYSTAGFGMGQTYFSRHNGLRIDHLLFDGAWVCRGCRVGPAVGSPHRALVADFERRRQN